MAVEHLLKGEGDLAHRGLGTGSIDGQLQQIGIMNRVSIESSKITALNNYPDLSGDQIRKGATSLLTMDVLHGQGTARQVFHDYAPRSLSLLTDTRLQSWIMLVLIM